MQSEIKLSKSWFPTRYNVEYQISMALPDNHLPELVDQCIKQLIPVEVFKAKEIIDLKGRDPLVVLDSDIGRKLEPQNEELLFVAGNIYIFNEDNNQTEKEPFRLSINTSFSEFVGVHHISHKINFTRSSSFPEFISFSSIGRIFPLEIEFFRLGLDLFTSHFATRLLGFTPTVTQSLYLDCHKEKLYLKTVCERLKNKTDLPLSKLDTFNIISKIIERISNKSILEDYQTKLDG